MRQRLMRSLVVVLATMTLVGCDPLKIKEAADRLGLAIDDSTRKLMEAVAIAAQESTEWRAEVDKLGNQFQITADNFPLNVGTQSRMFVDFAIRRLKDNPAAVAEVTQLIKDKNYILALKAFQKLQEANPLGRVPEIGQAIPTTLSIKWISHDKYVVDNNIKIIRYNGWDIPLGEAGFKAEIRDDNDKKIRDVSKSFKASTKYDATLYVDAGSGVQFLPTDRIIMLTYQGRLICQVQVTWGTRPLPPPPPPPVRSDIDRGKLDHGRHVFEGFVGKLTIREINGESYVEVKDCIEVRCGLVDGKSTFIIVAKGDVTFTDKIDGRSRVEVTTDGNVRFEGKIDGRSKVTIHRCRDFLVRDKIDGGNETVVDVTYYGSENVPYVGGGAIYNRTRINPP